MFRAIRQDTVHIVNDPSGLRGHVDSLASIHLDDRMEGPRGFL